MKGSNLLTAGKPLSSIGQFRTCAGWKLRSCKMELFSYKSLPHHLPHPRAVNDNGRECDSSLSFCAPQVRRWIKSPMVSVDKHQSPSLKYSGPSGLHLPPADPDFEPALCQSCLGDHAFQRGLIPPEESCSWDIQPGCEVSSPSC